MNIQISKQHKTNGSRFFTASRCPLIFLIALSIITLQTGCSAKNAYTGHAATDLSELYPGLSRAQVEAILGTPEMIEHFNESTKAWYLYNRGFVGSLEETSMGEKIFWAPLFAWGEFVSLGLIELMGKCQAPCQKGLLEIDYDASGHLLRTTEHFLPDNHPELKSCTTTSVRANLAICEGIREQVRPSSIPKLKDSRELSD